MKIREFNSGGTQPFKLKMQAPKNDDDNSFSILVGANGTRKSRTMRDIVDIVVPGLAGESELFVRKPGQIRLWKRAIVPRVIAVSGVATDRFPSRMNSKRYGNSVARYSYIGPRTDSNLVSRVQAVQQIAAAILADHQNLKARSAQLRTIFSILSLDAGLYFELEVDRTLERGWSIARLKETIDSSRATIPHDIQRGDLIQRSSRFLRSGKRAEIRLDLDDADVIDVEPADSDVLHLLLQVGVLRVIKCHAMDAMGVSLDLRELSSGQWHLLSSLLFVATTVTDNTLVLVDEPENSLHPAWQQEYLPLLKQAVSSCKGVHVVVSTHSPHVASSLSPDVAEVIVLKSGRTRVVAKPLVSEPYGWAADDILRVAFGLETTRSRGFSQRVDAALKLFAKGDRKDPVLVKRVRALEAIALNLPDDDAVREMINTMAALVGRNTKD